MKILFLFLFCLPFLANGQMSRCFDDKEFNIRNEIELRLQKEKWKIFEIVPNEEESHFIAIQNKYKCIVNKKALLSINEVQGYATNFIKAIPNGFYYSFEYGSRFHYEYDFYFKVINKEFYLYKVVERYSDLLKPNKQKVKVKAVKNIPFEQMNIRSYIRL